MVVLGAAGVPMIVETAGATNEDVVLEDGAVLLQSITARSITVPVTATVYYGADIVLAATESIAVRGQLAGGTASPAGSGAFGITLDAKAVTVTGSIKAADGQSGDANVAGGNGGASLSTSGHSAH